MLWCTCWYQWSILLFCRVKGMLMINVLAVAAGLLMGLCKAWKPHIMVIMGRAVMGFYCGMFKYFLSPSVNTVLSYIVIVYRYLRLIACFRVVIWFSANVHWRNCTQEVQRCSGSLTPVGCCHWYSNQPGEFDTHTCMYAEHHFFKKGAEHET